MESQTFKNFAPVANAESQAVQEFEGFTKALFIFWRTESQREWEFWINAFPILWQTGFDYLEGKVGEAEAVIWHNGRYVRTSCLQGQECIDTIVWVRAIRIS